MLVAAVEKATANVLERGEQIAMENPDIRQEMLAAVDEVKKTGAGRSCRPLTGIELKCLVSCLHRLMLSVKDMLCLP